jgi:hypothetical protein
VAGRWSSVDHPPGHHALSRALNSTQHQPGFGLLYALDQKTLLPEESLPEPNAAETR